MSQSESASESESESESSRSSQSSYSSESFQSEHKTESKPKKKDVPQNKGQGQGRGKPPASQLGSYRNNSRMSSVGTAHQGGNVSNNAARRMLSAGRLKINELRNKVAELTVQLANVQSENKQLMRQQRQQERLLVKFDHQENEAPVIVQRINEEANALREQLRRTKERYESKCQKLRTTSEELDRTQRLLKKMKNLVDDKKLAERDELNRKLIKAEEDINEKDTTIRDLYKHVENLQKNHRHEIGIERARHRDTQQTLEKMQELDAKLQMQLKEKEKELGVRNIYAFRQNKPPHHLDSSVHSTPISSSGSCRLSQKPKLQSIRPLQRTNCTYNVATSRKQQESKATRGKSESEPGEELDKDGSSVELTRQLEEEKRMLATLQAEQEEDTRRKAREKQERERREFERQKRELEREKERAERERKELEEQRRRAEEEAARMTSAEVEERRRQKELLLAKMKAIDDGTVDSPNVAAPSSQTMNGPTSSKRPVAADDDVNAAVFGEYRPSFLAGSTNSAKTKKTSKPAASRPRNSLLIFDDDLTKPVDAESPDLSFLSSQPSQAEMGAGDRNGKHLLPRRPRQQATAVNGTSSLNVVSDLSDEIEEVIL